MAGVRFSAVTGEVSTGTSAKTILQVVAANHHRLKITEIEVSFNGTSNTATPIKVDILRQSTAGTMSALTPVKINESDDETLQVTAQHTSTSEPTPGDVIDSFYVHPQTGRGWQSKYSEEIPVKGGNRLGIRVTAAADVNCIVKAWGEE